MSYTERPAFLQALHFDKILADCVKMHPCLYDTKTRGYRDKTDVDNAWDTIASNLKVENGLQAQKLFSNLKKRFHKKRNLLKRLRRSGSSSQSAIKKVHKSVMQYSFLHWLIPYTQVRQPRNPIPDDTHFEIQDDSECSGPENISGSSAAIALPAILKTEQLNFTDQEPKGNASSGPVNSVNFTNTGQTQVKKPLANKIQNPSIFLGRRITEAIQQKVRSSNYNNNSLEEGIIKDANGLCAGATASLLEEDEDRLFGLMIASELKKFPYRERCIAKHEIQNIVFSTQMSLIKEPPSEQMRHDGVAGV